MNTRPEALIGSQIDQYQLLTHIARGGMADVYLAQDRMLNRQAAVKLLLPSLLADPQFSARFLREAQTAAQLDHPNIVQIFGIGQAADGRPYLAMQFIEGGSLQESIDQLRARGELVDNKQALAIVGKMADALALAHAAGIIHRDIKPSNILIRPDGSPVLVDLGIAAVQGGSKLTNTGTLIGTPHYMSPEQAGGKKLDGRTDIYSLGVILYELLTGRTPFESSDPMAVLHCQIYEQPTPLESLRPDLSVQTRQLVAMCMDKDPGRRFQNAAALRQAVNAALQAEGGSGIVNQAGMWQPYPSSEYRLSPSKIARRFTKPTAGSLDPREWPNWLAAAAVVTLMALALFSFKLFIGSPAAAAGEGEQPAAVIAAQPSDTPTAVPSQTATFIPLPSFTPTATPAATDTAVPTATPAATETAAATATSPPTATAVPTATPTSDAAGVAGLMVEDFEYADAGSVLNNYWINAPGNDLNLSIATSPMVMSGKVSLALGYQIRNQIPSDYVGLERFDNIAMNWRGAGSICLWIYNVDFPGHLVFQFREKNGEVWKHLYRLSRSGSQQLCMPFQPGIFELTQRPDASNDRIDLDVITNFAFYLGGGGIGSGIVYLDALTLSY